ncbi:conserved hypothetical protein [Chlorobaculum parvum NCIB 8327]|uniref:Class I SAM-dependent methyltransferase n=1 Tax=Chlorobaculum parvum (strain DSM 263 / NCIMB 8327) TaxID=517417 RepID=B3QNI8_CHLP8|nr:class I SAM-dependent methyltransferase [Chlorobaculum parvum]ACF11491.1 conserved hypothetical protein [Chlorobaculum parvum NCIB 8327]
MTSTSQQQSRSALIEAGIRCALSPMVDEDDIWSRYSNDKTDIGEHLARVIRTLSAAVPLNRKLRALSIGSSSEPQFRILETAFRGGLYLLDIDPNALETVRDRVTRQNIGHVSMIAADYNEQLHEGQRTRQFLEQSLDNRPVDLITLHHSLYYCEMEQWVPLFRNIHQHLLARSGAIHAVLMAPSSRDPLTTTSLYSRFAGNYFGICNDQSLPELKRRLERLPEFRNTQLHLSTSKVRFYVNDFVKLMKVVWMILLYPGVHQYSDSQKKQIASYVYDTFYAVQQPLYQEQHHLVLYRGIRFRGLG